MVLMDYENGQYPLSPKTKLDIDENRDPLCSRHSIAQSVVVVDEEVNSMNSGNTITRIVVAVSGQ